MKAMSRRAGAAPATGNTLDAAIKRQRAAAVRAKTVEEFYIVRMLGDTDLYQCDHPNDPARSYRVDAYEGTCTCPAWRESTSCKHCAAVEKHIGKQTIKEN
jgi:hypothetical protein